MRGNTGSQALQTKVAKFGWILEKNNFSKWKVKAKAGEISLLNAMASCLRKQNTIYHRGLPYNISSTPLKGWMLLDADYRVW